MKNTLPFPAAKLMTLLICMLAFTSCTLNRLDRSEVPEEIRQYDKFYLERNKDCILKLKKGEVFIEFKNTDQEMILDEILNVSKKYAGEDFTRESVGGQQLTDWIKNQVYLNNNQHAQFEPGVLTYASKETGKLIQHNDTYTNFDMKDYRFRYGIHICPTSVLPASDSSKLFHTVTLTYRDSVTSDTIDKKVGEEINNSRSEITTKTFTLPYRVETFATNICFKMEMKDKKTQISIPRLFGNEGISKEKEYYRFELKDTIRVHHIAFY